MLETLLECESVRQSNDALKLGPEMKRVAQTLGGRLILAADSAGIPCFSGGCRDLFNFQRYSSATTKPLGGCCQLHTTAVHQIQAETSADSLVPVQYRRLAKINEKYRVLEKDVFAVVEVGATQFKVTPEDLIYTQKLKGMDVNDKVSLDRVLLLGSKFETVIGRPFVPGASVIAAVEVIYHSHLKMPTWSSLLCCICCLQLF